jgi:hypothetical protein
LREAGEGLAVSDLLAVLLIVVVWLAALVMLVGLCASAKDGDRTRITDWGDVHAPPRAQRYASAARVLRTRLSRQPLARARRIRAGLAGKDR